MKPFTSFDGADANGVRAEVYVQVGEGVVEKIEGLDGTGRNVQVQIKSTHDAVRKPIKGWLQRTDPLLTKVVEARDSGEVITYRTESQRKKDIDRTLPLHPLRETTDLAQKNCISIFAGMNGVLSQEAVTNPAEDPAPGGRIPATPQNSGPQQAPAPAPTGGAGLTVDAALQAVEIARKADLPDGVLHAAIAQALAAGASLGQVQVAGFNAQAKQATPPQQSAFATEAAAYKMNNTDGRINLGSYAVQAMFGAERFATDLIAAAQSVGLSEDEVPAPVDLAQAAALADVLLGLADRVQVGAYGGGRVDRGARSHTRARSLVFDAIEARHPVPFDGTPEDRDVWSTALVDECVDRFRHLAALASQAPREIARPTQQDQGVSEQPAPQQPAPQQDQPAQASAPQQQPSQQSAPQQEQPAQGSADRGQEQVKRKAIIEGEEGFVAPDGDLISRFATLAQVAGFEPVPNSPVVAYLMARTGVGVARKINADDLNRLVSWYEGQGPEGAQKFHAHVTAAAEKSMVGAG